jgi:putative SOS response-associated peptidase YedK
MCGRFVTVSPPTILADRFGVETDRVVTKEPDYNVTPRADIPVVATSRGVRVLDLVRWGLVPSWAKDLSIGDRCINARAETVATKAAYKRAFVKRRCIIPADGFYEWERLQPRGKQPWFIRRRDGEPLAFAGLWEIWHDPDIGDPSTGQGAPRVRSCTIVTTTANDVLRPLHDRMPVVLPEDAWSRWLDPTFNDVRALQSMLVPAPDGEFEAWRVATLVNVADNNGPELLEPIAVPSR